MKYILYLAFIRLKQWGESNDIEIGYSLWILFSLIFIISAIIIYCCV